MNKFKELNFRTRRWIFSKVLENTLFTIVLTALASIWLSQLSLNHITYILAGLFILGIIYKIVSHEKKIKKVDLDPKSLMREWTNNEFRTQITSVASVSNKALYLQFMDIPFTLNVTLPLCYAFEFKAKALNTCFGWCVNVAISGTNMRGYLFQYFPDRKNLSPVFLVGYNSQKHMTLWVVPDTPNSPIKSVGNLVLRDKDGWYSIRTEVYQYETDVKIPDLSSEEIKKSVPVYKDEQGNEITFDRANTNKVVEIKIYDMNDLGKNVYHIIFNEPPFKCFWGGKIGFRNHQFESALYKDILINKLS